MPVLVTGAAGFIGAPVCDALLARGEAVIRVDDCNAYYDPALKQARLARVHDAAGGRFVFHHVDFADAGALKAALADAAFDRIVYLGAQARVRYSLEHPGAYVRANLVGHANLLELARARAVAHLVCQLELGLWRQRQAAVRR